MGGGRRRGVSRGRGGEEGRRRRRRRGRRGRRGRRRGGGHSHFVSRPMHMHMLTWGHILHTKGIHHKVTSY